MESRSSVFGYNSLSQIQPSLKKRCYSKFKAETFLQTIYVIHNLGNNMKSKLVLKI